MASPINSRIGRTYKAFSSDITINPIMMISQEIGNWKNAINAARSIHNPRRRMLLELFDNIKIDGHLYSVMNKREIGITNKRLLFEPSKGIDIVNENIDDKIIETPWFSDLLKLSCEAVCYGHSLIEMIPGKDNLSILESVEIINRANVIPEWGFVMKNANDLTNGIYFRGEKADPYYSQYLIEVGGKKDYGLLMIAAQYVIYKRGGFGDWAQFAELFGMPFRVGKYNMFDDLSRKKLDEALNAMGGAGYAVIPDGTSLDFHQSNGTGQADIFKQLVDECNAEMSKIFVGQTMTTENGSSRSQGEVHKDVEEEINMSDMIRLEYVLNWALKPKILAISRISDLEKGKFRFPQTMNLALDKRWVIDSQLCKTIPMTEEYFYRTYGVSKPGEGETIIEIPDSPIIVPGPKTPKGEKKKNKLIHNHATCCVADYKTLSAKIKESDLTPEETDLINAIYNKDGVKYDYKTFQQNITKLRSGLMEGLSKTAINYGSADNVAATMMEVNINRFGFDKNLAQIYGLNQALKQTGSFADFKKEAVKVLGNFNRNYLETEYNFAIATAQNASAWNQQKANQKDFPFVKYVTAGDERVRAAHAALDGKIFRLDDTSWTGIYPPNGFGCRCEVISINDPGRQDISTGDDAKQALGEEWDKMKKGGFAVNRGELNEVFDLNKSYAKSLPDAAIQDTNKLTYADAGLKKWADMTGLKAMPVDKDATAKTLLDEFDKNKSYKQVGNNKVVINLFDDYSNRPIGIAKSTLNKHIKGAYEAEKRYSYYHNVADVLAKPDEVYFLMIEGKTPTYRYIKFYSDEILVVTVDVTESETLEVKTWYTSNKGDAARTGVLIKNKKG